MSKIIPKPKAPLPPPPPPTAPTSADASVISAGQNAEQTGYSSLISTTPSGLSRKASTAKTSLIGGN